MDFYTNDDAKRKKRGIRFLGDKPGINGILIASTEGLPIVSALPYGYNETLKKLIR